MSCFLAFMKRNSFFTEKLIQGNLGNEPIHNPPLLYMEINQHRKVVRDFLTFNCKSKNASEVLIEISQETGLEIDTVIWDTAYSRKENICYKKEKNLELAHKLNLQITQSEHTKEEEFQLN